jgi:hypothetical protein
LASHSGHTRGLDTIEILFGVVVQDAVDSTVRAEIGEEGIIIEIALRPDQGTRLSALEIPDRTVPESGFGEKGPDRERISHSDEGNATFWLIFRAATRDVPSAVSRELLPSEGRH